MHFLDTIDCAVQGFRAVVYNSELIEEECVIEWYEWGEGGVESECGGG